MSQQSPTNKGIRVWLPLLFALVMILGMWLGFKLHDTLRTKRATTSILIRNDRLAELINLISERYVDSVDVNQLYTDAIAGIISHLDPHTTYIPEEDLSQQNEELEGKFYGIGVEFSIYQDTIYITKVLAKGPAEKVGIDIGDKIIKVGDTLVAGVGITNQKIVNMLKGQQHAPVVLAMMNALTNKVKNVTVKRDEIPLYSVDASYLLDSITGYIKINRFAATTYNEFKQALQLLLNDGARKLVIDLRGNPGGYMKAATQIADELIDGDKLLVYTEGYKNEKRMIHAAEKGLFEKGSVVVLLDEFSASASEILAGAIQDWDRGLLIGRQSYGKGLVQQQFDLDDGSAIRLTTARYYTPSGRSIQRSYAQGKEQYYNDYKKRLQAGWGGQVDTTFKPVDTTPYFTAHKRVVYAAGGITPDILVTTDTGKLPQRILDVIYHPEFKGEVRNYFLQNRDTLRIMGNLYSFNQLFNEGGIMVQDFLKRIDGESKNKVLMVLQNPVHLKYVMLQAKAQLAQLLFGDNGYYYVLSSDDKIINEARHVIHEARYDSLINRQSH